MKLKAADVLLSPQEAAIAAMICAGKSNVEIAQELGISKNTVSFHVREVCKGLEISTRCQLVLWCLQHPRALTMREWSGWKIHPPGCECLILPYCIWSRGQSADEPVAA